MVVRLFLDVGEMRRTRKGMVGSDQLALCFAFVPCVECWGDDIPKGVLIDF
jgi:uncharacterized protein YbaA (DUF1428 family)